MECSAGRDALYSRPAPAVLSLVIDNIYTRFAARLLKRKPHIVDNTLLHWQPWSAKCLRFIYIDWQIAWTKFTGYVNIASDNFTSSDSRQGLGVFGGHI